MANLASLIAAYESEDMGYVALRSAFLTRVRGDYDQLARHGEWDITDPPQRIRVGR